ATAATAAAAAAATAATAASATAASATAPSARASAAAASTAATTTATATTSTATTTPTTATATGTTTPAIPAPAARDTVLGPGDAKRSGQSASQQSQSKLSVKASHDGLPRDGINDKRLDPASAAAGPGVNSIRNEPPPARSANAKCGAGLKSERTMSASSPFERDPPKVAMCTARNGDASVKHGLPAGYRIAMVRLWQCL